MKISADTMKAVVQDTYGDASDLYIEEIAKPQPGKGEVRIRVRAVALNPADKFVMRGEPRFFRLIFGLTKPRNRVRGLDFAGIVDAVGTDVTGHSVGDEVFGEFDGTLAEYACGPVTNIAKKPAALTFEQAAAIPVVGRAAMAGVDAANIGKGTRLLINGASGGIGTFFVQLAKARGAHVTAVCSTRNVELVKSLGADQVIDYLTERLLDTEERFDVILDNVGNYRLRELLPLLNNGGLLQPNTGESGPDGTVITRMVKGQWISLTSKHRVRMFTSAPFGNQLEVLGQLVSKGELRVVIDSVFDFERAPAAMERLVTGHACGKVIVNGP